MLRITSIQNSANKKVIFKIEGRIIADWVAVLRRECQMALALGQKVILDLSKVTFVDDSGVKVIRELSKDNLRILNCSAFIQDLLNR